MKTLILSLSILLSNFPPVSTHQEQQTYTIQSINSETKEIYATSSNPNDNLYLDQTYFNASYKEGNTLQVKFDKDNDIVEVSTKKKQHFKQKAGDKT